MESYCDCSFVDMQRVEAVYTPPFDYSAGYALGDPGLKDTDTRNLFGSQAVYPDVYEADAGAVALVDRQEGAEGYNDGIAPVLNYQVNDEFYGRFDFTSRCVVPAKVFDPAAPFCDHPLLPLDLGLLPGASHLPGHSIKKRGRRPGKGKTKDGSNDSMKWTDGWRLCFDRIVLTLGVGNAKVRDILPLMRRHFPHIRPKQVESFWQARRNAIRKQYGLGAKLPGNECVPKDIDGSLYDLARRWVPAFPDIPEQPVTRHSGAAVPLDLQQACEPVYSADNMQWQADGYVDFPPSGSYGYM